MHEVPSCVKRKIVPLAENPRPMTRNLHHEVVQIPLAATTFGISPRSGPDDSLFDFSLRL